MASDVSRVNFTTWASDAAAAAIIRLACALMGHVVRFAVVVGGTTVVVIQVGGDISWDILAG